MESLTSLVDTIKDHCAGGAPDTATGISALSAVLEAAAAGSADAHPDWKTVILGQLGEQNATADVEQTLAEAAVVALAEVALVFAQYSLTPDAEFLEMPTSAFVLLQSLSTYFTSSLEAEAASAGDPRFMVGRLEPSSDFSAGRGHPSAYQPHFYSCAMVDTAASTVYAGATRLDIVWGSPWLD